MLSELSIENFAIIEQLELHLDAGLIIFTGETGAGKSIIIDAVETLLGGRVDTTMIRSGAQRANIEARFRIPEQTRPFVHAILEREALLDDPDYLTLAREIRLSGGHVARVNGRHVNVGLLRELGEHLIDVHGQSEHLSLLQVSQHIGLLDRFAATDPQSPIQSLYESYRKSYQRLQEVQRELENIRQAERDAARRMDMLNYQINEIEAARLRAGEEEELQQERNRLANAEGLISLVQEALVALDESDAEHPAATDLLGQVIHALTGLARLDPSQTELQEQAQLLFENMSDLARSLRNYLETVEFNPKRLDQVEERLALIYSLKRKYGDTIPAILEFANQAKKQLDTIVHAEERVEALEVEKDSLMKTLGELGHALSQQRTEAAQALEQAMESELADLHMSGARFKVDFRQQETPDGVPLPDGRKVAYHPHGLERVEFLIAPNPGEGFKPLVRIASGGETSRLMLALKNVLAQADRIPTLIFDEIDQGIGGRVGAVVGHKLWNLGRKHQVLCITHLPQLAAFGKHHFHVQKLLRGERTVTEVKKLQDEERLVELAQMLGGLSEGTLQSAHEILESVAQQVSLSAT